MVIRRIVLVSGSARNHRPVTFAVTSIACLAVTSLRKTVTVSSPALLVATTLILAVSEISRTASSTDESFNSNRDNL